ncbi:MoaD/ThiS family protein [Xanthobacter sp. DSM 24535]|uniref:MoaD/ThiS family protein n=1 Tax=Roseixanthobacter psychrophilus TaxID=3119917 RepID=UPI003728CD4D
MEDARTHAAGPGGDKAPEVLVRLPAHLVALFPGAERRLWLQANTVAEMVDALDAMWPGMRDRLCDTRPAVRRHINIFVSGRRATLATRLASGQDVFVLTAISGG